MRVCQGSPFVTHLYFADDSIVFGEASIQVSQVVKRILETYEKASGQQVNFEKLVIFFSSNVEEDMCNWIVNQLGVRRSFIMERYLGLLTLIGRRKWEAFYHLYDRIRAKVSRWSNRYLSQGEKEVYIKAVLQAFPIYSMLCFLFPKSLCLELESIMRRFWWQKSATRKGCIRLSGLIYANQRIKGFEVS